MEASIDSKSYGTTRKIIVVIAAIIVVIATAIVLWANVANEMRFLIKSADFPNVEARYAPIGDMLSTATQDKLLDEDREISNYTKPDHPQEYTGIVEGEIERIYGANRPLSDVINDYSKLFDVKLEWKKLPADTTDLSYFKAGENSATCVTLKPVDRKRFAKGWSDYQAVYEVKMYHYEMSTSCLAP